jgi:hypothetical protein
MIARLSTRKSAVRLRPLSPATSRVTYTIPIDFRLARRIGVLQGIIMGPKTGCFTRRGLSASSRW